jgi:hypothetical protein
MDFPRKDDRPWAHENGVDRLLDNVDALLAQAAELENEHEHHEADYNLRAAAIRATEAQVRATMDLNATMEEVRRLLFDATGPSAELRIRVEGGL